MKDFLKSIGGFVLGIFFLVAILTLVALFLFGAAWFSEKALPVLNLIFAATFFILVVVVLPLSIFRKCRGWCAVAFVYWSYFCGLSLWMFSLLVTLNLWGYGAAIIGLILMGVGILPVALLACTFKGEWSLLFQLLLQLALLIGCRFCGFFLAHKAEQKHSPVTQPGATNLPAAGTLAYGGMESDERFGDVDGSNPLRLLVIDSNERDARTIVLVLNQQGFEPIYYRCVETIEGIRNALLDEPDWSLILCEYKLPQLELSMLLPYYKPCFKGTPFIVVSDSIGEQVAAEMMARGAHDCIRKCNLSRLGPVVKRELKAAETRCALQSLKEGVRNLLSTKPARELKARLNKLADSFGPDESPYAMIASPQAPTLVCPRDPVLGHEYNANGFCIKCGWREGPRPNRV